MRRILNRNAAPVAREWLAHFPALIIEGARQVGKSTFATMVADPTALITTFDDPATLAAAQADPTGFIDQAAGSQMIIDEIQRFPEITLPVKASIDADRRPGRFILTGSSSLLRVRGTADSLAGRAARLNLYGLSQGETRAENDDIADAILADPPALARASDGADRSEYAEFLAAGAYPEIRQASARIRNAWLDSYVSNITGRDLPELGRMVDSARAIAILRTLAGRQAAELVKAKLADETSVPAGTITRYIDLLHDVGLVSSIPAWTPNLAKREIARPKTFVSDPALALRLARMTAGQLTGMHYGEAFGSALEAFVASELMKQRTWSAQDYQLFHWRDSDGGEVDLILEFGDGTVVAFEVKAAKSFAAHHFRGLKQLRDALGPRFLAGVVLNTSTSGYRYADRLWGAPISSLWTMKTAPAANG